MKNLEPCDFCRAGNSRCARVNGRECKCNHCLMEKELKKQQTMQRLKELEENPLLVKELSLRGQLEKKEREDPLLRERLKESSEHIDRIIQEGATVIFEFEPFDRSLPKDVVVDFQHYTPEFYLDNFKDKTDRNGRINVLDLKYPDRRSILRPSSSFGGFNGFMSYVENGQVINDLDPLFNPVETDFSKLINSIKFQPIANISPEQYEIVCKKMALMHLRTPKSIDFIEKIAQNNLNSLTMKQRMQLILHQPEVLHSFCDVVSETRSENGQEITITVKVRKKEVVLQFKTIWDATVEILKDKDIHLVEFSSDCFISGDHPCFTYNKKVKNLNGFGGFAMNETEIYFPISPNQCLMSFSRGGAKDVPFKFKIKQARELRDEERNIVKFINYNIVKSSKEYIISTQRFLSLEDLRKKLGID